MIRSRFARSCKIFLFFALYIVSLELFGATILESATKHDFFKTLRDILEVGYYISGIFIVGTVYYAMLTYKNSKKTGEEAHNLAIRNEVHAACDNYLKLIYSLKRKGLDHARILSISNGILNHRRVNVASEADTLVSHCDRLDLIAFQILRSEETIAIACEFIGPAYIDTTESLVIFIREEFREDHQNMYKHMLRLMAEFKTIMAEPEHAIRAR